MLRLCRTWPMLGFINFFLLIVIIVGIIVLAADYTRGRAFDLQPHPLVEMKLSGEKRVVQLPDKIFSLYISQAFYSVPEIPSTPVQVDIPPERWMEWPVIPVVSERAIEIFRNGLAWGNNPKAFSIVGDYQSEPQLFVGVYDSSQVQLPADSQILHETISQFSGSFSRWGPGVIDGGTPATVLARSWSSQNGCGSGEIPLECELRIHKPVIVFVNLGTHWTDRNPQYLRQIVSIIIEHGAVPILATKADNLEGNFTSNLEMARIAREFDVPLWNMWAIVQDLPNSGLDPVKQGGYMYLTEEGLARRRLSALQVLDSVWRGLKEE